MSDPEHPQEPEEDQHSRAIRAWRERSAVRNALVSRAATPATPRHARVEEPAPPARVLTPAPSHLPAPEIDPRTEPMARLSFEGRPVALTRVVIPRPLISATDDPGTEPILNAELVRAIRALSLVPAMAAHPAAAQVAAPVAASVAPRSTRSRGRRMPRRMWTTPTPPPRLTRTPASPMPATAWRSGPRATG